MDKEFAENICTYL